MNRHAVSRTTLGVLVLLLAAGGVVLPPSQASALRLAGGAQVWVSRWNGPDNGVDWAFSVAASPDGTKVFATGQTGGLTGYDGHSDYGTVAYSSSTGAQLWGERFNGTGNSDDHALSLAVSPDGTKVYVTGWSYGASGYSEYATVAYDASMGTQLWVARYGGPYSGNSDGVDLALSPDGSKVFVTGFSPGANDNADYATVAYDATAGTQLWVARYNSPGNSEDVPTSIAVSPGGARVFVTGSSPGPTSTEDYTTVAYDSATGKQVWLSQLNGPNDTSDYPVSVVASPDGSKVFVTGSNLGGYSETVAYDAGTGATRWVHRYAGPNGVCCAAAFNLAASPDGSRVFVTGYSFTADTGDDYGTLAYDASTGVQLWVATYNGPAPGENEDLAYSIAVSPGGQKVFVTGSSYATRTSIDYATVGYSASTGDQLWISRYNGPGNGFDIAYSISVSPGGQKVYVTGRSRGVSGSDDYATVAYKG